MAEDGRDADQRDEDRAPEVRPVRRWRTRSGALIGVLLGLLGFALAVQVKSTTGSQDLGGARQEDLVQILDDLDARKERLNGEISSLQERQRQLSSSAQGRQAALDEARQRADELGILAGTLAAEGPGLSVGFTPGVKADAVLNAVEELRGAGGEAMQVAGSGGAAVRIVASSSFVDRDGGLLVDGHQLAGPYTLLVIGDPGTMRAALNIPGGVVDTVRRSGGSVTLGQPEVVRVSALRQAGAPRYARPVS